MDEGGATTAAHSGGDGDGGAASRLGSAADLTFFASRLRDVTGSVDAVISQVGVVVEGRGDDMEGEGLMLLEGGGGGGMAGGGGGGEFGTDGLDLLNRQIKAYLAAY